MDVSMTNAIDVEINTALETYRAECERQNISRSIDHEKAVAAHLLLAANPGDVLRSDAFANLSAEAQMPHVIRAVLHRWPDTDRGKLAALMEPVGTDADTDDEPKAPKAKRRKAREIADVDASV